MTVIESSVPPGDETPPHVHHETMDEAFYVLEGEYTCQLPRRDVRGQTGLFPSILPMDCRTGACAGPQGGRKLILGSPAGLEDFFRDMANLNDWDELGEGTWDYLSLRST